MSPQPMPPFAYMPSIDFFWNSLVTLTTSVPLESLHLEIVNPQTGSWDGSGELYLGCTGPLIASLTRESETYPSLPDRTWGEADLGSLAAGTYVVLLSALPISNLDVTLTAHVSNFIHFNGPLWTSFVVYQDTCDGPGVRCLAITPQGGEAAYDLPAGDYHIAAFGSGPVSIH